MIDTGIKPSSKDNKDIMKGIWVLYFFVNVLNFSVQVLYLIGSCLMKVDHKLFVSLPPSSSIYEFIDGVTMFKMDL